MQYKDKEGDYMELEFDVKVTPSAMYDYLLHHTYSGHVGYHRHCLRCFFDNGFSCHEISDLSDCRYRSDRLSAGCPLAKGTSAGQHDPGI